MWVYVFEWSWCVFNICCISGTHFFFFFAKALSIVFPLYEKCFLNKVRFSLFNLVMDWWKDGGEEVAAGWEELQIEGM